MPTELDERIEAAFEAWARSRWSPSSASLVGQWLLSEASEPTRGGFHAGFLAASSAQRPVDAKDADALWEKFERYVDAESWTTPRCKRALYRIVQEARAEERERAAKLCEDRRDASWGMAALPYVELAAAIRARREGEGEDG